MILQCFFESKADMVDLSQNML